MKKRILAPLSMVLMLGGSLASLQAADSAGVSGTVTTLPSGHVGFKFRTDFNGDGHPDVLVRKKSDGKLYAFNLDANGKYSGSTYIGSLYGWEVKGSGDFDGNGVADIVISRNDGTISRVLLNSDGTVKNISKIATMSSDWVLENTVNDFNGDGIPDILVRRKSKGYVYAFYLNNNGKYTGNRLIGNLSGWEVKGSADFDGNGVADIVITKPDGTIGKVLLNTDGSVKSGDKIVTMSSDWVLESAVDDFNGDGHADILVRRKSKGYVYAFYLNNNGKYTGNKFIGNLAEWEIKGSADFDGNGVADIVITKPNGTIGRILLKTDGSIKSGEKIATMSSNWALEQL